MMLLLLLLLSPELMEGGVASGSCPAACRCDRVGTLRVDCVDVGLRSVPSNLSSFTSSLSLQNNLLKKVPSEAFKNLKNLRSLRLDANFISRLPASSFKGLRSLRHLWLDDNVLTEVPVVALRDLTELQALTLALNNISYVPDGAFSRLRQLLVLHLRDNRIHSLGRRSFDGLHDLETLDLSFNRINSFPVAIKHLTHLRDLNLQNNNISVVPENCFCGNPSIQTINIQKNPLHTVGHSSFQLLPELQDLSLSGGSVTQLPDFTGTSRLETLSITGHHLSSLPANICEELPHLQELDLSHNLLQTLPSFSRCRNIRNIDLSSNRLSSVSLKSLTHLKLSGHLKLRVSHQHLHRKSDQLFTFTRVFLHCESTRSEDGNGVSTSSSSLWLLHFVFIVSIVFNLLLLFLLLAPLFWTVSVDPAWTLIQDLDPSSSSVCPLKSSAVIVQVSEDTAPV